MKVTRSLLLFSIALIACSFSATVHLKDHSADEAALRDLVSRYYATLSKDGLIALVTFWSRRSPDLNAGVEDASKTLERGVVNISELSVSQIKIVESKATLQASAIFNFSNQQTNTKQQERRVRNFALVKEDSGWNIWREADSSHDFSPFLEKGSEWKISADSMGQFALILVNAGDSERERLLSDNKNMITTGLRDALARQVGPLRTPNTYERAVKLLLLVEQISEQLGDKTGVASAERQIGDLYREWSRWGDALKQYQTAAGMYEKLGRRALKAAMLVNVGQVYFAQKKYQLAIENYEKALADFEALNISRSVADTLEELASVYYDQENYDRALELSFRCLKLRESYAGKAEIAATLNSIGNAYFQQQEFDAAIQHYQRALAGFEDVNKSAADALKDYDSIVSTLSNIASTEYSQGSYESALEHYLKALRLQDNLRDRRVAANLRANIAKLYSAIGNYSVAIEYLQQSRAVFESLRDKEKTATTLSDTGEAYFQLRNYDLALSHYEKSAQLYQELRSPADLSMRLYAIGNVHFFTSNYDLAVEYYEKAMAQFEAVKHMPGIASMLASIAGTRYAQQKFDLALEYYQKSLEKYEALNDKSRAAGVVERIASVRYSKGEYPASLETVARAIAMAEQTGNSDALWRARYTEGLTLSATEKVDLASESFKKSIATIELMRSKLVHGEPESQHFFQNKNAVYAAMMENLVAQNKIQDAFAYAERIRANTLIDIFQKAPITRSMTAAEAEQERRLERLVVTTKSQMAREREKKEPNLQRYASLDLRLQKSLSDYRAFEAALYAAHPRLKTLRGEAEPQGLENAATLLSDSSTVFLEFVVADTRTYLFALTRSFQAAPASRSQAPVFALNAYVIKAGRAEVAERVKRFREMITNQDSNVQQNARDDFELLLGPAREQLTGKKTFVISPDDSLWQMPFAALRSAENHYLIEDRAIAFAPSLAALTEMIKTRDTMKPLRGSQFSVLVIGNPIISQSAADQAKLLSGLQPAGPAPEAENEVKAIERMYTTSRAKAFVGVAATESLMKQEAGKYSVIHLAAPAILSDSHPLYSHIALSQSEGSEDDGLLQVKEISLLNLSAELFVMSFNQPARERHPTGDSLNCLAWSLFVAGCPSSIIGQWMTNSDSTTELMLGFHRSFGGSESGGTASKARDLQRAMLEVLRNPQFQHPFYWAGMSLVGDFR
ncbi:MAG TPA: tetratricopeptide repeat protein [Blastocatellia bacterium]|nr:tetratricopeptide repeat protein [Blastocatellia bacterium]